MTALSALSALSALTDLDSDQTDQAGHADRARPARAATGLEDIDSLQRAACSVRRHVLRQLPQVLERFADEVLALGAHVCWAPTAADARHYIASVAIRHRASRVLRWTPVEGPGAAELGPHLDAAAAVGTVARGRPGSTPTEEIDVDRMIVACQADVVETGLRQWIARLADEAPSHIVAAAPHRDRRRIPDLLVEQACATGSPRRRQGELVRFARERLRRQFLGAEVGVGTADLAVAETGSLVLVTDQPNTRLATALPEVHVVVLGLDQVIAGWDQADLVLALHHQTTRVAGQANGRHPATTSTSTSTSTSTTVITGPRQPFELDGPRELHVVVLDNGRSRRLGRVPTERGLR